jgi:hypothetical protein
MPRWIGLNIGYMTLMALMCVTLLIFRFVLVLPAARRSSTKGGNLNVATYPSGPVPIPFLGNVSSFLKLMKNSEKILINMATQYGEMCMLWLGRSPVLIINSPTTAKDLLDKVSGC